MADITNPQAIAFANNRIRVIADLQAQLYYASKALTADWFAQGVDTVIPNNAGDTVVDGSATDGRAPITGAKVNSIITRASEYVTDMEANTNSKLNTVLAVAVNADR